jgi:dTDP-glucose 4,6-dehydratase
MINQIEKVLITGGAGFIGSNFIYFLQEINPEIEILNLDLLTYAGSLENLTNLPYPDRHHFIQGDICNRELVESLFSAHKIDLVVHFAAESHVDRSIIGPGEFIRTNIQGTFVLLEAVRKAWAIKGNGFREGVRFHHISTDEIYGTLEPSAPAFSEKTPVAPNSPYSASKAASDHLVRAYFHTYGLPVSITNCSNNYGPRQFPEKLIPLIILNAQEGKPLPIYGDGKQIRDWLFVEDHCQAIWKVINESPPGETYNVGGDNQPTNLEIVQNICDVLDELLPESDHAPHYGLVQHVKDRPGHDRRYAMDIRKINKDLGWKPQVSLSEGIIKTVKWYLDHPDWIDKIRNKGSYQDWVKDNYQERESK